MSPIIVSASRTTRDVTHASASGRVPPDQGRAIVRADQIAYGAEGSSAGSASVVREVYTFRRVKAT